MGVQRILTCDCCGAGPEPDTDDERQTPSSMTQSTMHMANMSYTAYPVLCGDCWLALRMVLARFFKFAGFFQLNER